MTVLVTGGCGLAGSFAVRHAVECGERVIAYDIAIKAELLQDISEKVTFVKGDVLNASELMGAINKYGVDRILHLASMLTPGVYERPYAGVQTIVMGTMNVLEAARLSGVKRLVYLSTGKTPRTASSYGKSAATGVLDLDADPYTSAKVACELFCNDYRKLYNLDIVILRFAQVFGPGYGFAGVMGQSLKDVVEKPLRNEPVKLASLSGTVPGREGPVSTAPVGCLYARDAGSGAMMATLANKLKDYVFQIRPKEQLTQGEVADLLRELIPGARIEAPRGTEKGGAVKPDPLAQEQFGYIPQYSVRRGLKEYIEFLKTGHYCQLTE